MSGYIISIRDRRHLRDKRRKTLVLPGRKGEIFSRRGGRPFEYTNTRTIHYETYRTRSGTNPDYYYYNQHNEFHVNLVAFKPFNFWWFGNIDGTQLEGGAGDNVYSFDVVYEFTFSTNTTGSVFSPPTVTTNTWTWEWTGTPDADSSGSTSQIITDTVITTPYDFSAMDKIAADLSHAVTFFAPPWTFTPGTISGSEHVGVDWYATTRTLSYHIRRDAGAGYGLWDDDGHPGVTVYGNNIQGETTFYGGAGFGTGHVTSPHFDDWTTQIQTEADALIALLEAEPHIRNVSESDISITTSP